jgi:hypothetical protein
MFVDAFESCAGVDRVTKRPVVELRASAKVADDDGAAMHPDACVSERPPLALLSLNKCLGKSVQRKRAIHRTLGVIRLLDGGGKYHRHGITNDAIDRSIMGKDRANHAFKILIQ